MPDTADSIPMVEFIDVTKRWGSFAAVDGVNLRVNRGEFITLLGPSGCGKTTMLRMIGGFETPTAGRVLLDGQDITHAPPYRRPVNQVFQSYALFPHLTVRRNVEFGLRMKKLSRAEIAARTDNALKMVALGELAERRPHHLSGGQRQRVALARAIVNRPKVLLLDEPLSALDAKLRHAMQLELKQLQHGLGITFVFVTHDQEEALTMSDRIAVIDRGKIEQIGPAQEIYHQPRTRFVANFIGTANLLDATVLAIDSGTARIRLNTDQELMCESCDAIAGANIAVSIRPEKIVLSIDEPAGVNAMKAIVEEELFKGPTRELIIRVGNDLRFTAMLANESDQSRQIHRGDGVWCNLNPRDLTVIRQ